MTPGSTEAQADRLPGVPPRLGLCAASCCPARHYRVLQSRQRGRAVKPIPVVFHLGPLQIHTYGIGLAITFFVSYRYFARRLRNHGYDDSWLGRAFVWIIVASIIGARAAHVVANWSGFYAHNLGDIFAVWHGGLSSFGGLGFGVPTGL